jgi:hypothetical protein
MNRRNIFKLLGSIACAPAAVIADHKKSIAERYAAPLPPVMYDYYIHDNVTFTGFSPWYIWGLDDGSVVFDRASVTSTEGTK